jgi:hypothetical protein
MWPTMSSIIACGSTTCEADADPSTATPTSLSGFRAALDHPATG